MSGTVIGVDGVKDCYGGIKNSRKGICLNGNILNAVRMEILSNCFLCQSHLLRQS